MNDDIVNGIVGLNFDGSQLMVFFIVQCVDYLLVWLLYYIVILFEYFQNFVLFMNYQFYVDEFEVFVCCVLVDLVLGYIVFVVFGNQMLECFEEVLVIGVKILQMFVYYLKCVDGDGIMLVNIGVGLLNVKIVIDYIVVLCLYVWLMVGYCVGLCNL